ncbi:ribose 5-phosphate isomerase B [Chloroflexota bacterium]
MRVAIGSDHRGLERKQFITGLLTEAAYDYQDFGSYTTESVDYPDIARNVAVAVANGDYEYGILICGTGIGMSIAANKVNGIRAALCYDVFTADRARRHNDANILCVGTTSENEPIRDIVTTFLATEFEGGRHQHRVDQITAMED